MCLQANVINVLADECISGTNMKELQKASTCKFTNLFRNTLYIYIYIYIYIIYIYIYIYIIYILGRSIDRKSARNVHLKREDWQGCIQVCVSFYIKCRVITYIICRKLLCIESVVERVMYVCKLPRIFLSLFRQECSEL